MRLFTSVTMVKREMDCFPHSSVVCVALTLSVKTTILSVCFGISITSLDSASHTNPQCNALPSNSLNAKHFKCVFHPIPNTWYSASQKERPPYHHPHHSRITPSEDTIIYHDGLCETGADGHSPEDEIHVNCVQSVQGARHPSRFQRKERCRGKQ